MSKSDNQNNSRQNNSGSDYQYEPIAGFEKQIDALGQEKGVLRNNLIC